ncbi:MAG: 2-C-methyl-D-erythritol 4-phosphate cytidylyltransferase [Desulfotignum sp.]|nr:2-C-methyl-D-erythritol 4-phosphate cytidylyltransferase [Desulfobacteraceae bacterium]
MEHPVCIPIIVAAGKGCRMGTAIKKQYLVLDNIPVLTRTLMVFDRHGPIEDIILVIPKDDQSYCRKNIIHPYAFTQTIHLIAGGDTRQESVVNGLNKACELTHDPAGCLVLIHDGVRPFVTPDLIERLTDTAVQKGGCIPVLAVNDTLKQIKSNTQIHKTLDRDLIYRAQTPQVFCLDVILRAFEYAKSTGFAGTDDASVMEHAGFAVYTTPGDNANIKLTTPDDLILARHFMEKA